jgi:hypothetical protein
VFQLYDLLKNNKRNVGLCLSMVCRWLFCPPILSGLVRATKNEDAVKDSVIKHNYVLSGKSRMSNGLTKVILHDKRGKKELHRYEAKRLAD